MWPVPSVAQLHSVAQYSAFWRLLGSNVLLTSSRFPRKCLQFLGDMKYVYWIELCC